MLKFAPYHNLYISFLLHNLKAMPCHHVPLKRTLKISYKLMTRTPSKVLNFWGNKDFEGRFCIAAEEDIMGPWALELEFEQKIQKLEVCKYGDSFFNILEYITFFKVIKIRKSFTTYRNKPPITQLAYFAHIYKAYIIAAHDNDAWF